MKDIYIFFLTYMTTR